MLLLWLAVLAVFSPALWGDYVDDDLDLLISSPAFAGIEHVWEAVRSPFWGEGLGYWRPLTSLLLSVGHAIGHGHPWPTHAMAVGAHLAAATLVFEIARRLEVPPHLALLAAAAFALHPCQVESVAWVAALGDPLAGAATLLAVYSWLGWRRRARGSPWGAWAAVALAIASKESGVGAVGWLLATEFVLGRRVVGSVPRGHAARRAWLGVAAVVAVWLLLRALVFGDLGAGFDRGRLETGAHGVQGLALRAYLACGFATLPTGWSGFTPYRWIPPDSAGLLGGVAPLAMLLIAMALAMRAAWRGQAVVVGLGVLGGLVAIAPAVLLPQSLGPWPLVDRYAYLLVFGVVAVPLASGRCRPWLASVLVVVSAVASSTLVPAWRTQERVVARALADCPRHPEPHYLLGNLELQRGDRATLQRDRSARAHYARAVSAFQRCRTRLRRPLYAGEHLRAVLGLNARIGEALAALSGRLRAIDVIRAELAALASEFPDSVQVLLIQGAAHAEAGDVDRAEKTWLRALALDEFSHQAAFNLGRLYLQQGRLPQARGMLARAVRSNPQNVEAKRLLAGLGQ